MGYIKDLHKKKAYAVGVLDITVSPPQVTRVSIMRDKAATLARMFHKTDYFDLAWHEGLTFEEAEKNLLSLLENYHPWALTLLK